MGGKNCSKSTGVAGTRFKFNSLIRGLKGKQYIDGQGVWLSKMNLELSYLIIPLRNWGLVKFRMTMLGCGLVNYRIEIHLHPWTSDRG